MSVTHGCRTGIVADDIYGPLRPLPVPFDWVEQAAQKPYCTMKANGQEEELQLLST
jgi:hypothetical protein